MDFYQIEIYCVCFVIDLFTDSFIENVSNTAKQRSILLVHEASKFCVGKMMDFYRNEECLRR